MAETIRLCLCAYSVESQIIISSLSAVDIIMRGEREFTHCQIPPVRVYCISNGLGMLSKSGNQIKKQI